MNSGILGAMDYTSPQPDAGWYPDPAGSGNERYWDGAGWSHVTRPNTRPEWGPGTIRQYASWGHRAGAFMLDIVLLILPGVLILRVVQPETYAALQAWVEAIIRAAEAGQTTPPEQPTDAVLKAGYVSTLILVTYRAFLVGMFGATAGKLLLGLRVVPVDEMGAARPGALRAIGRAVVQEVFGLPILVLLLPLNYLLPLFTERKQTLHDMAAGTVVVRN